MENYQDGTKPMLMSTTQMDLVKLCIVKIMDKWYIKQLISIRCSGYPFCKRARKFVPLETDPVTCKAKWKPSLKVVNSSEHSVKGYADDVILVSDNFDIHVSVLQTVDQRACDLDLSFKPVKVCIVLI